MAGAVYRNKELPDLAQGVVGKIANFPPSQFAIDQQRVSNGVNRGPDLASVNQTAHLPP